MYSFLGGIESSEETEDSLGQSPPSTPSESHGIDSDQEGQVTNKNREAPSDSSSRREKITKFLKVKREEKMMSRDSIPRQQRHIIKEDLHLKRKLIEQAESIDKEFLQHAQKMAKTMDTLTGAMTGCFQMMQSMFELQMQQSRQSMQHCYQDPRGGRYHYGHSKYQPSNYEIAQSNSDNHDELNKNVYHL